MKKIKKIDKSMLLYVVALIVFFEPGAFNEPNFSAVDSIYDIVKILFACVIFIKMFLLKKKEKSINITYIGILTVYQAFCLFSTIYNHGSISRFIGPAITSIFMIAIVEILVFEKKFFKALKYLNIYFRICFLFNLVSILIKMFIFDYGNIYFLGIDNRFIFTFLPWIYSEFITDIHYNKRITKNSIIPFCLAEISLLIVNTMAAMIVFTLWIIPILIKNIKKSWICITYIVTFIMNFLISKCHISFLFSKFLNKIGKFPHLSGRTMIWDAVFEQSVPKHCLIGIGIQSNEYDKSFFERNVSYIYAVNHAHNTFIDILYRYGCIGVVLFGFFFMIVIVNLIKNHKSRYAIFSFVAVLIFLILGVFDTLLFAGLYFVFAVILNLEKIESNTDDAVEIKL